MAPLPLPTSASTTVEGYATTTTTRRRRQQHQNSVVVDIPSGGYDMVDDDDHGVDGCYHNNNYYNDSEAVVAEEKKDDHHHSNSHYHLVDHDQDPSRRPPYYAKEKKTMQQQQQQQKRDRNKARKGKKKRRSRTRDSDNDPPFILLLCQVGTTLLAICLIMYHSYRWVYPSAATSSSSSSSSSKYEAVVSTYDDELQQQNGDGGMDDDERLRLLQQEAAAAAAATARPTPPPLPQFTISDAARWDAFGILQTIPTTSYLENDSFWKAGKGLRQRFIKNYGGENAARMLIDQGTTTFSSSSSSTTTSSTTNIRPGGSGNNDVGVDVDNDAGQRSFHNSPPDDVVVTACRFYDARQERRPFRMAFGGYSVTTGRGNKFEDSYPLQLQNILETVVKMAGIPELQVHNAAIGGCPSFPYGWCMKTFWGGDPSSTLHPHVPDIVNWDYSMNESSGSPEGLEAYVRHLLTAYHGSGPPPKLLVKDHSTARHRRSLLNEYSPMLRDAVALHTDRIVQPFLAREEEFRPPGFQRWHEWGAPKGAPGQVMHHPAVQEHALNAWILTMHLLTSLEYMMANLERMGHGNNGEDGGGICGKIMSKDKSQLVDDSKSMTLPPPVSGNIMNNTSVEYDPILFGRPIDDNAWVLNPVQCRTTFQPIRDGDLSETVVSGTIGEELDTSLPKSQMYYNRGWTLDLSEAERTAKRRLSMYPDALGFVDSKEAYYGIYESPHLKLLLPLDSSGEIGGLRPQIGDEAREWVDAIVLCEVNEKNIEPNRCNLDTDVGLIVGGVNMTSSSVKTNGANQTASTNTSANSSNSSKMIKTVGSVYLGKPICKHVSVPAGAKLTSHNHLLRGKGHSKYVHEDKQYLEVDQVGLLIQIYVSNPRIAHVNQACSISHVVWDTKQKVTDSTKR